MSTEPHRITVDGMPVDIVRKRIKNLHLAVYPPNGRVRVAAPLTVSDEAVRLAVVSRLAWIKKQKAKFESQKRQSARDYVSGESHYFLGRRYRLNIAEHNGPPRVCVRNGSVIDFHVRQGSDPAQRERAFLAWYRREMRDIAEPLIDKWSAKMELTAPLWGIRRMKTRWGTCNIESRRIWLNLELVKKPRQCLEYIVVHEMAHFMERHHNDRFVEIMDRYMPQWRLYRDELNAEPLAHEDWTY